MLRLFLLLIALLSSSCEFKSYRAAYRFDPGVTYTLRFASGLDAKPDGSWGKGPYASGTESIFSAKGVLDSSKGQINLAFTMDSLKYHSSERAPEEDAYMVSRLRKYRARMALSRTGQALSLEEEPGLPPVEFSPLNFGRLLIYGLPSFPDADIKKGSRWELRQPLLDKFHPESQLIKRFRLASVRETPQGRIAVCEVAIEALLDEELGAVHPAPTAKSPEPASDTIPGGTVVPLPNATMAGKGRMEFNLDTGRPISTELEVEGVFISQPTGSQEKSGDSGSVAPLTVRLKEHLSLHFSE